MTSYAPCKTFILKSVIMCVKLSNLLIMFETMKYKLIGCKGAIYSAGISQWTWTARNRLNYVIYLIIFTVFYLSQTIATNPPPLNGNYFAINLCFTITAALVERFLQKQFFFLNAIRLVVLSVYMVRCQVN